MWRLNGTLNPNIVLFERPVTRGELKKRTTAVRKAFRKFGSYFAKKIWMKFFCKPNVKSICRLIFSTNLA